jgi:two-component system, LytTR family, sensor kinase
MPIFKTKYNLRSFWHYQIIGFSIYWVADFLQMFSAGTENIYTALGVILQTPAIFGLTLILRERYKRINYKTLSIVSILWRITFWSLLCTIVWYLLITYVLFYSFNPNDFSYFNNWKTSLWWLVILFVVPFGWSILYFGIKYWLYWDLEKKRAEEAKVYAEKVQLQMLRYQLNPHFLFNALNSIRALIEEDRQNAKTMVTELSEFLRYSSISRNSPFVTLEEELNAIKHYISIEKKRFEEKLIVEFDIDPSVENYSLPNFMIHSFIENSIKYGMQTSTMPLRIWISAKPVNGKLSLSVINTGKWVNQSDNKLKQNSTGTGLENVLARLQNAFHGNFKLEHEEKDGKVFILLEIPALDIKGNEKNIFTYEETNAQ